MIENEKQNENDKPDKRYEYCKDDTNLIANFYNQNNFSIERVLNAHIVLLSSQIVIGNIDLNNIKDFLNAILKCVKYIKEDEKNNV
jgi:hypothetical protein